MKVERLLLDNGMDYNIELASQGTTKVYYIINICGDKERWAGTNPNSINATTSNTAAPSSASTSTDTDTFRNTFHILSIITISISSSFQGLCSMLVNPYCFLSGSITLLPAVQ